MVIMPLSTESLWKKETEQLTGNIHGVLTPSETLSSKASAYFAILILTTTLQERYCY